MQNSSEINGNTVRILLAEDEALVRRLVSRTLRRAGYDVIEAEDGTAALEMLLADARGNEGEGDAGAVIDAVVTDVVMPGLSGPEFVKRGEEELGQTIPVLFMSGYLSYPMGRAAPIPEGATLLQKPFTASQLLDELEGVLQEHFPSFKREGARVLSFRRRTGS